MDQTRHASNYPNAPEIECSEDTISRRLLSGLCTANVASRIQRPCLCCLALNYILGPEGHLIPQCLDENGGVISR